MECQAEYRVRICSGEKLTESASEQIWQLTHHDRILVVIADAAAMALPQGAGLQVEVTIMDGGMPVRRQACGPYSLHVARPMKKAV